jgi:fructose-1,6-bisphosphatase I
MENFDKAVIPEYSLDRDCQTLSRHVLQQFADFTTQAQDVSAIMNRIALAAKLVSRRLSRAGLMAGALGRISQKNGHLR